MPGLVVFGRRWVIASDDFVFPGAFELFIRFIWWILMLVLFFLYKGEFNCSGGQLLYAYVIGLIVLLAIIINVLLIIVCVSMQGTITNPGPRKSIPLLIYIRTALYLPELVWACLGAVWISDNSMTCHRSVVIAVLCAVIASWIICFFTLVVVLIAFDPLGNKKQAILRKTNIHDQQSSEASQLFDTAKRVATRVWENRLKLMCCCIVWDNDNRAAFANIAEIFTSFFSGTDMVPSDIAAGLSLIHQEQDKLEKCREPEEVVCQSSQPSASMNQDLDMELENATHYMVFAAAAYGWPLYIFSNPFTGACQLCCDCCRSRPADSEIIGGTHRGCHFASMLKVTQLQYRDFIYITFHNKIYEIPFYVALDHKKEAVVVAVRGTLSLRDALTDLSAECEELPVEGVPGNCCAHKGMVQTSEYIYSRLINDGILNQAFSVVPEYRLVITGHSLGAGTAALLAIRLRRLFPGLKCYAFSPPGGLLSKPLADYSKDFTISIIVGKDLVPRLSIPNMEELKRRTVQVVANCTKPKYKILLRGCWYEVFGGNPDDFPSELSGISNETLSQPLLAEQSLSGQNSNSYSSSPDVSPSSMSSHHQPLYPPGRIIHITEEGSTGRLCYSQVRYKAAWSKESAFSSIYISPKMITDHMPDVVLKALENVTQDQPVIVCSQPPDDPVARDI
ncbi:diacylglycerol lipase-beta [Protopterus annectens]|uniref:diacylglycerol lipase-beta n=1 Tax=Protopterus annectens TaxID=7888 RepID=UPI001CFA8E2E|nr:diacylglycerol lipase-beta [Protopterus annectens]